MHLRRLGVVRGTGDRRRAEIEALADLATDEFAGAVAGIHDVHRAITDRIFRSAGRGIGRAVTPVRALHDGITDGVYATIDAVARTVGGAVAANPDWPGDRPPSETVRGASVIGAALGLIGDHLEADGSPLADHPVTVRVDGSIVSFDEPGGELDAGAVFDGAGGHVVVLLHGLCESEFAWGSGGIDADDYGVRLAADLGATPIYVRYNSGRHISSNGSDLAGLLERLVTGWPVPVTRLDLIGHSMGGLVARAAAHRAEADGMTWPTVVSATVSLGTPHLGAPLEEAAHYGSAALAAIPETAALSRLLRRRSAGIRDLRGGSIVDEDWDGHDANALGQAIAAEVPLLPNATHYFVTATITRDSRHPLGRLLGDGLVLTPSGSGRRRARRIGFAEDAGLHVGGTHHLALLRSDAVYDQLREWLR